MKERVVQTAAVFLAVVSLGCSGAQYHHKLVSADEGGALTVGTVQREIKIGMPGSAVAEVLGAPNIVTTDEKRREVWVYDRIATDRVYSADSGGISSLIFGGGPIGGGVLGGGAAPAYGSGSGAESTTQRTFTVIIKFDEQSRVRDFAYHTSRF